MLWIAIVERFYLLEEGKNSKLYKWREGEREERWMDTCMHLEKGKLIIV